MTIFYCRCEHGGNTVPQQLLHGPPVGAGGRIRVSVHGAPDRRHGRFSVEAGGGTAEYSASSPTTQNASRDLSEKVRSASTNLVGRSVHVLSVRKDCTSRRLRLMEKYIQRLVARPEPDNTFRPDSSCMTGFFFRYAYHLRRWALEGRGVDSHVQLMIGTCQLSRLF